MTEEKWLVIENDWVENPGLDPADRLEQMFDYLETACGWRSTHRKAKLFMVACIRDHLASRNSWNAEERLELVLDTVESAIDGQVVPDSLMHVSREVVSRVRTELWEKHCPHRCDELVEDLLEGRDFALWECTGICFNAQYSISDVSGTIQEVQTEIQELSARTNRYAVAKKKLRKHELARIKGLQEKRQEIIEETIKRYLTHAKRLIDIAANPFRPVSFDPRWRTSDVVDVARGIYEDKAFERMPILADALMDAGCEDEQIIGHC